MKRLIKYAAIAGLARYAYKKYQERKAATS